MQHVKGDGLLHIWGDGLSPAEVALIAQLQPVNPRLRLEFSALSKAEMAGAKGPDARISGASMGRLLIPKKLDGRVLYIDGDTRITADPSQIFDLDMQGKPLAAVRDYVVSKWCRNGAPPDKPRVRELRQLMGQEDISHYFNSGVLLIDTSAVRATPALFDAMTDVIRASASPWGDQDHLNSIFTGNVRLLDPAWNSSWSRTREQRAFIRSSGALDNELTGLSDVIVHFHGSNKPWLGPRYDFWSRRGRAVMAYRRVQKRFQRAFPLLRF
ncbi:Lipopolysaccharide 3-alpha-galactosyltransferase [Ketogulonicigenium vulgare Y25]|nr:glycosyltransferase [Ketogulonicigenium vulgare]ADO41211.1 Lipopolysaccharide 3-alpha-galactosyltransferase [Ketogulonicigenium vulgare Y25]AOZ53041.1 Lipopolysaccharide 3-alpha-galactosyltransferase [Ketogulonicigenium vulgare]